MPSVTVAHWRTNQLAVCVSVSIGVCVSLSCRQHSLLLLRGEDPPDPPATGSWWLVAGEPGDRGGRGGSSATAGWLTGLSGSATSSQTTPPCCYQVAGERPCQMPEMPPTNQPRQRGVCLYVSSLSWYQQPLSDAEGGTPPLTPRQSGRSGA